MSWARLLFGSSNAKTREDNVLDLYVFGGFTQLGFCVMVRAAYDGFSISKVLWHSSGVHGPLVLDIPVGMLLIRILDHLTFAVI